MKPDQRQNEDHRFFFCLRNNYPVGTCLRISGKFPIQSDHISTTTIWVESVSTRFENDPLETDKQEQPKIPLIHPGFKENWKSSDV